MSNKVAEKKSVIGRVEWEKGDTVHELIELGGEMRFPFRFGRSKARLILEAIEELGLEGFKQYLAEFVEEADKEE